MNRWQRRIAIAGALALTALAVEAQGTSAATDAARDEIRRDVERVKVVGPAEVMLKDQARLALPAARMWVPQPVAGKILEAMGNRPGPRLLGLVYPLAEADDWIVVAEYEPAGYVKDDDARDWNADDLLKSYREGTEASNEERVKLGAPALQIIGWAEKPAYDGATHRLVWAMATRAKDSPADAPQGVNYNTYALGRDGVDPTALAEVREWIAKGSIQRRSLGDWTG